MHVYDSNTQIVYNGDLGIVVSILMILGQCQLWLKIRITDVRRKCFTKTQMQKALMAKIFAEKYPHKHNLVTNTLRKNFNLLKF